MRGCQNREHAGKIAAAIKQRHIEGKQPKVTRCPACQTFVGASKTHNCQEIRLKLTAAKKANPTRYWLDKKRPEMAAYLSQKFKGRQLAHNPAKGDRVASWKGGISDLPYAPGWNRIKYQIRERDNYQCQICGRTFIDDKKSRHLHTHHINYDKMDLSPENLIAACDSCNSRANFDREFWEDVLMHRNVFFKGEYPWIV